MDQFKNIDLKKPLEKPRVSAFVIRHMIDESPDLSFYEDKENYKTGEKIRFPKKHYPHGYFGEHVWDAREYADHRLSTYGNDWWMIGIRAECQFLMPVNSIPSSAIMQGLTSGGLWGIENNSGEDYLKEVQDEELTELKRYCTVLGIEFDENTPVILQDN